MGKVYCTECGTELDDSVKFCSSCGSEIGKVNSNNDESSSVKNVDTTTDLMKRIEIPILIGGILSAVVFFYYMGYYFLISSLWYRNIGWLGIIVCSFLVGYLSRESIKFVMGYAVVMDVILFLIYSNGFGYQEILLPVCIVVIIFAFIGKFVKIKLKS